jgi:hypothetical protein
VQRVAAFGLIQQLAADCSALAGLALGQVADLLVDFVAA